jgi:hypothetical protein
VSTAGRITFFPKQTQTFKESIHIIWINKLICRNISFRDSRRHHIDHSRTFLEQFTGSLLPHKFRWVSLTKLTNFETIRNPTHPPNNSGKRPGLFEFKGWESESKNWDCSLKKFDLLSPIGTVDCDPHSDRLGWLIDSCPKRTHHERRYSYYSSTIWEYYCSSMHPHRLVFRTVPGETRSRPAKAVIQLVGRGLSIQLARVTTSLMRLDRDSPTLWDSNSEIGESPPHKVTHWSVIPQFSQNIR